MIQAQNLSFSIGEIDLLKNVNWTIKPRRRIGLIGPNGAGKTTFFRIITGEYQPTGGTLNIPKKYSIGYLPQEEIQFEETTIVKLVLSGHEELLQIEKEIKSIHDVLDKDHKNNALIEKLGLLESRFNLLGGYQLESNAKKVLAGLGFSEKDFNRSILEFSGGWRMRAHLARLLLQQPDFLLMDEPTNHLDLSSLEWLEEYLQNFPGTLIIISHDRFFLDRLVNEIAELENGKMKIYSGNFQFYEQKKELEAEQYLKNYESQKAERERLQKFVDRFRYKASKASQVQSRIKMLEKMEVLSPPEKTSVFTFSIKADTKSFKDVLNIKNMAFSYGENAVFNSLDLHITRGEKIALVGDNGQGKTTLTKLIYGDLAAQKGSLTTGEKVNIGYYAQHQVEALNLNKTILQEVEETAADSFRPKLRDILGLFRFHGNDANKTIGVLSGGEKARVSLAKILLSPCNFLIMDEPTNHLDVKSKEALEHALREYDGTLLVIAHDRYFLDRLVTRVVEIKEGVLFDYPGNYSYYLDKRKQYLAEADETAPVDNHQQTNPANPQRKSKEQKRQEAEARKAVSKERNVISNKITDIEKKLEDYTKRKSEIENLLADPATYNDPLKGSELNKEYTKLEERISRLEYEWEENHINLEELLKRLDNN